jgi:hypothetical protein
MRTKLQLRQPIRKPSRAAYKTLRGWALGVLIEEGAVDECEHHGHRRDRSDLEALCRARERAWAEPFPDTTPATSTAAIEDEMRGLGDTCPDCD